MAETKVQKFTTHSGVYSAGGTTVSAVNHCVAENHQMTCFFRRSQRLGDGPRRMFTTPLACISHHPAVEARGKKAVIRVS